MLPLLFSMPWKWKGRVQSIIKVVLMSYALYFKSSRHLCLILYDIGEYEAYKLMQLLIFAVHGQKVRCSLILVACNVNQWYLCNNITLYHPIKSYKWWHLNVYFYNQSSLVFYMVGSKRIMQCNTMMIEKWTNKNSSKAWCVTYICQKEMFSRMLTLLSFHENKNVGCQAS